MNNAPTKIAAAFWSFTGIDALLYAVFPSPIYDSPGYYFGTGLFLLFLVFAWFLADARRRGLQPKGWLKLSVLLLPPIAIPFYKFRYAGAAAGFRFLGLVIALYALIVVLQYGLMSLLESANYYA